jgi:hypothetical protein
VIQLHTTSGSDLLLTVTITDTGGPVDLTGRTLSIFEASAPIADRVSASFIDAENGIISIAIEGSNPLPAKTYSFRLQINSFSGSSIGLPIFFLSVK